MNEEDLIKLVRIQAMLEAISRRMKGPVDQHTLERAAHDVEFVILKRKEDEDVAV